MLDHTQTFDVPKHYRETSVWSQRTREIVPAKLKYLGHDRVWAGAQVLQVQCESGLVADGLARRGCVVTAVDTRPEVVAFARKRSRSHGYRINYRDVQPKRILPFADQSFDMILCDHVFERDWDTRALAHDLRRLLRPGGRLMVASVTDACLARLGASLAPVAMVPGLPLGIERLRPTSQRALLRGLTEIGFESGTHAVMSPFGAVSRTLTGMRATIGAAPIWLGTAERL